MAEARLKSLQIKTCIVRRLTKDKVSYEKEIELERSRLQRLKDEGKDEHVVKKQEEVVRECLMMVPDSQRRLEKGYEELKAIIEKEVALIGHKDYLAGIKALEDAQSHLTDPTGIPHFC